VDLMDRIIRPKTRNRRLVGDARSAVARANAVLRRVREEAPQGGDDSIGGNARAAEDTRNEADSTDCP